MEESKKEEDIVSKKFRLWHQSAIKSYAAIAKGIKFKGLF